MPSHKKTPGKLVLWNWGWNLKTLRKMSQHKISFYFFYTQRGRGCYTNRGALWRSIVFIHLFNTSVHFLHPCNASASIRDSREMIVFLFVLCALFLMSYPPRKQSAMWLQPWTAFPDQHPSVPLSASITAPTGQLLPLPPPSAGPVVWVPSPAAAESAPPSGPRRWRLMLECFVCV